MGKLLSKSLSNLQEDKLPVNSIAKNQKTEVNHPKFDLESQVSMSVSLESNFINLAQLKEKSIVQPMLISIGVNDIKVESRASIDLICIIDISGSMEGEKIELVKNSMISMMQFLEDNDRLCIILFESSSEVLCHLTRMTMSNKSKVKSLIKGIHSKGGTKISLGFEEAMRILSTRKCVNNVTGIMLLSDGCDDLGKGCFKSVSDILNSYENKIQDTFSINTFGFGKDHDSETLTNIARLKDGSFYFIDKLDVVDECFVNCIGGLISVVAQNSKISAIPIFESNMLDVKIIKAFGVTNFWELKRTDRSYNATILQLVSGRKLNFVFEIEISLKEGIEPVEGEIIPILNAQLDLNGLLESNYQKVTKFSELSVTLTQKTDDKSANISVSTQYFRIKLSEKLDEGIALSSSGENRKAQTTLGEFKTKIEDFMMRNKGLIELNDQKALNSYIEQLTAAIQFAEPKVFQNIGKQMMQENCDYQLREKSNMKCNLNSNCIQERMVAKTKSYKK